jgi:hypothetical protein
MLQEVFSEGIETAQKQKNSTLRLRDEIRVDEYQDNNRRFSADICWLHM